MKRIFKNRLIINIISYAILQIVNMLIGLLLPRYLLAVYGSEVNGIISTINSFISYFTYLEAGLGLTLIHSLFKPLAEGDVDNTNSILTYSKKKYRKISYIYFILVVLLSLIFPFIKIANDIGKVEFILLVFVIGAYGALDFYSMAKYRVLLTADRKEYVISNAMIVAQVIRFIVVFILLKFQLSVVLVKVIPILTLLIRSIILRIYVKKKYPNFSFSSSTAEPITASKYRWDALLLQISIVTSASLPTIVVSQFLGYKEANVFAIYTLVVTSIIAVVSALSSGVSPMLGRNIAKGKSINDIYNIYDFLVSIIIAIIFSITAVLIMPFISIYTDVVDDINYIVPEYAILISLWAALYTYRIPVTAVINAAGIYRPNRIHNISSLIIQVVGGILATISFGITGLLVVMIIAAIHRNITLTIVNNRELLHNNSIVKSILRQVVIIVIISLSFVLMNSFISTHVTNFLNWIKWAIIVSIIELVLCSAIFSLLEYKTVTKIFNLLKQKFKKKQIE